METTVELKQKGRIGIEVWCQQHSDFQEDGVLKKKERGFMLALRYDADFADYRGFTLIVIPTVGQRLGNWIERSEIELG